MAMIDQLSEYLVRARTADLPAEVARKGKHHILDTLAAMVSALGLRPGHLALRYARSQRGVRESTIVGSGNIMAPAATAALVNGILAHADETDDTHWSSRTHPGCAIIPAALSMAEKENSDGQTFLNAVVAGYDVGCRLTRSLGVENTGWHSTHSIGGTFGAAVAASTLAGLSTQQIRWALSYAAQQASGVRSWVADSDHIEKAFDFGGMPARNGVSAAILVQSGFTGMADVFEGEKNFLGAYSPSPHPDRLVEGLGSSYEIMATSIKRFPVGAPIQAATEALLLIKERHDLRPESIERVVVRLPVDGAETVNNRQMPDINLQYIIAVILLDGNLSFEAAHDYRRMKEKRLVKMKERVDLLPDQSLSQAQIPRQGIVEVTTQDGETYKEHVVSARGTPDNPMSTEEVEKKAMHLMAPVLGEGQAQELIDKISKLESLATARELGSLLKIKKQN